MHLPLPLHLLTAPLTLLSTLTTLSTLTALTALVSAIPVSALESATAVELTPDTFAGTIEKGLWFVEHYSPYCGHCKHFKPMWDQLYVEAKTEIPEVNLGEVNCILYGDLCSKNGIEAWPTILMFEDGKIIDQFKGSRELDKLKSFMKRHIKDVPLPDPVSSTPATPEATTTTSDSIVSAPAPKRPVQAPAPVLNTHGEVLSLTSDTFAKTLAQGPTFIKFFAPWCGHCKKLAPTWKQLAKHMQGKVTIAEVNCDDEGGLCKSQDVGGYPTLVWYAGGASGEEGRSEYTSGRKLDQLRAFVEKASAAGVEELEKDEDLKTRVTEEDVVYLLLHSGSDPNILSTIRDASAPLLGSPKILSSSSPSLRSQFGIPPSTSTSDLVLLSLKDHDATLPSSTFYFAPSTPANDPKLRKWLMAHRLPTVVELTRDTFQGVMNAPQQPLVVLSLSPSTQNGIKEKVLERLGDLGKKWRVRTDGSGVVRGREVVFAFMDGGEWKDWLGSMYGVKFEGGEEGVEGTKVVIADHGKLVYYDTDRDENTINFMSSNSIFGAINDAASGATKYKHSESFVERIARTLNASVLTLESYIFEYPLRVLLFVIVAASVLFYAVNKYVNGDVRGMGGREEWVQQKGKNGRLD